MIRLRMEINGWASRRLMELVRFLSHKNQILVLAMAKTLMFTD